MIYVEAHETFNFDIIKVIYTMRLLLLMFVTAVCVLFLLKQEHVVRWQNLK